MRFIDWLAFASLLVAFVVEAAGTGFLFEYYDQSDGRRVYARLAVAVSCVLDLCLMLWLFVPALIRMNATLGDAWGAIIFAINVIGTLLVSYLASNVMGTRATKLRDRRVWAIIARDLSDAARI